MQRRGVITVLAAAAAAAGLLLTGAAPAEAATGPVGADVSWPQCGAVPPSGQAFALVGVNGGTATGTNPCLPAQLAWASTSPGVGRPAVEVYVNTADPAPHEAAWWPTRDRTRRGAAIRGPYGRCTGGATRACAWVYGASLAADDLQIRGVPAGLPARWWLDVEAGNSWSSSTTRNRAVLEGMSSRFAMAHAATGLYALGDEFHDLIGAVPADSALAHLPTWLAGAKDAGHAATVCTRAPLAAGRVVLVQWRDGSGRTAQDRDLACTALPTPPKPVVTGTAVVGATLHVKAAVWRPGGVHLTHRWTRDGTPIAGATGASYRLTARDRFHRIAVTVTGTRSGYSREVRTSASRTVR